MHTVKGQVLRFKGGFRCLSSQKECHFPRPIVLQPCPFQLNLLVLCNVVLLASHHHTTPPCSTGHYLHSILTKTTTQMRMQNKLGITLNLFISRWNEVQYPTLASSMTANTSRTPPVSPLCDLASMPPSLALPLDPAGSPICPSTLHSRASAHEQTVGS